MTDTSSTLGQAKDAGSPAPGSAEDMYRLGLAYSTGQDAPLDLVEAHKWFNLAALHGNAEAKVYRKDIAAQLTGEDIAAAQRAAREWLKTNRVEKGAAA